MLSQLPIFPRHKPYIYSRQEGRRLSVRLNRALRKTRVALTDSFGGDHGASYTLKTLSGKLPINTHHDDHLGDANKSFSVQQNSGILKTQSFFSAQTIYTLLPRGQGEPMSLFRSTEYLGLRQCNRVIFLTTNCIYTPSERARSTEYLGL